MVLKYVFIFFLFSTQGFAAPPIQGAKPANTIVKPAPITSKNYFTANVGYLWWQESLMLTEPNGTEYGMFANTNGPCVGGGFTHLRARWDFFIDGCAFFAFTDVAAQAANYIQSGVETYGVLVGPGFHYRPLDGQVGLGLQLPFMARYTNWTIPGEGYKVGTGLKLTGGALVDGSWKLGRYVVLQKMGVVYNLGWVWFLELQRIF